MCQSLIPFIPVWRMNIYTHWLNKIQKIHVINVADFCAVSFLFLDNQWAFVVYCWTIVTIISLRFAICLFFLTAKICTEEMCRVQDCCSHRLYRTAGKGECLSCKYKGVCDITATANQSYPCPQLSHRKSSLQAEWLDELPHKDPSFRVRPPQTPLSTPFPCFISPSLWFFITPYRAVAPAFPQWHPEPS